MHQRVFFVCVCVFLIIFFVRHLIKHMQNARLVCVSYAQCVRASLTEIRFHLFAGNVNNVYIFLVKRQNEHWWQRQLARLIEMMPMIIIIAFNCFIYIKKCINTLFASQFQRLYLIKKNRIYILSTIVCPGHHRTLISFEYVLKTHYIHRFVRANTKKHMWFMDWAWKRARNRCRCGGFIVWNVRVEFLSLNLFGECCKSMWKMTTRLCRYGALYGEEMRAFLIFV